MHKWITDKKQKNDHDNLFSFYVRMLFFFAIKSHENLFEINPLSKKPVDKVT